MAAEPGSSEIGLDELLSSDGEQRDNQNPIKEKTNRLVRQAGDKIKDYVAGYYGSNLYQNRLKDEETSLIEEIHQISGDNLKNFGIIYEQDILGSNKSKTFITAITSFQSRSYVGISARANKFITDSEELVRKCSDYENDVFKYFREPLPSYTTAATIYDGLIRDSTEHQTQSILNNCLPTDTMHPSERENLERSVKDTLARYYKSSEGIRYVLSQLGNDTEKKKSMDQIPEVDLRKVLSQIRAEYLNSQIKREGIKRNPVVTKEKREDVIDQVTTAILEENLSFLIIPKVGVEHLQVPLMRVARSFIVTENIKKAINNSAFKTLHDARREASGNKIVDKLIEDRQLLDYVEGRVLVDELSASTRGMPYVISDVFASRPDYFRAVIDEASRNSQKTAINTINDFFIRVSVHPKLGVEDVQEKLLALRNYFGQKAYGEIWEEEKAKLDKTAGITSQKEIKLPENLTARELKDHLSHAGKELEELGKNISNLSGEPFNSLQKLFDEYSEKAKNIAILMQELQKRL
jgi:hypothetical protein